MLLCPILLPEFRNSYFTSSWHQGQNKTFCTLMHPAISSRERYTNSSEQQKSSLEVKGLNIKV